MSFGKLVSVHVYCVQGEHSDILNTIALCYWRKERNDLR